MQLHNYRWISFFTLPSGQVIEAQLLWNPVSQLAKQLQLLLNILSFKWKFLIHQNYGLLPDDSSANTTALL